MTISGKKITEFLTATSADAADYFAIVDVSEPDEDDQNKKITKADMLGTPGPIGWRVPNTVNATTISIGTHTINEFSRDGTLIDNSDYVLPTEKAVKTYVDNKTFVATFLDLTDTPDSYVGHGDELVRVNTAENELEFFAHTFITTFLDLSDTPSSYVGQSGKFAIVNGDENAIIFSSITEDSTGNIDIVKNLTVNEYYIDQFGNNINEFSTDGTLIGNSDIAVPTEQAVKTYVDNHTPNLSALRAGLLTTIKSDDEVYVNGGVIEINDEVYYLNSRISKENTGQFIDSTSYIYVNAPLSGKELSSLEFTVSFDHPTFDSNKGDYYKFDDPDKRWLASIVTDSTANVITTIIQPRLLIIGNTGPFNNDTLVYDSEKNCYTPYRFILYGESLTPPDPSNLRDGTVYFSYGED